LGFAREKKHPNLFLLFSKQTSAVSALSALKLPFFFLFSALVRIVHMTDLHDELSRAARQLIAIEELLGGQFIPAKRRPLVVPEFAMPAQAVASPAAVVAQDAPILSRADRIAALKAMNEGEVKHCTKCGLCRGRHNTVFGEGDPEARLMFVGEGPGQDEDLSGRPFVGRAGGLLDKMIAAMGLSRQQVFIANIVKCRPPNNRAPEPAETAACWDYLMRQIRIIRPEVIVTLGNPAAHGLLKTNVGITKLRGTWQVMPQLADGVGGIAVMPTIHPAYVLRYYTPEVRGQVWSDLQQVMQKLGMDPPPVRE
jgi:DNA polymerase